MLAVQRLLSFVMDHSVLYRMNSTGTRKEDCNQTLEDLSQCSEYLCRCVFGLINMRLASAHVQFHKRPFLTLMHPVSAYAAWVVQLAGKPGLLPSRLPPIHTAC